MAANEVKALISKAREFHYGDYGTGNAPGLHVAEDQVSRLLEQSLLGALGGSRQNRALDAAARQWWDDSNEEKLAGRVNAKYKDRTQPEDSVLTYEDIYTPERVRNAKFEVVSRVTEGLIAAQTPIKDNFFTTTRGDAAESLAQTREWIRHVETLSGFEYFRIAPLRGDIPRVAVGMAQDTERMNATMQMYGAKVETETAFYRVLPNAHAAELYAMLSVGWSGASAKKREYDASSFLEDHLDPELMFSNARPSEESHLGQLSGIGVTGYPNGTFSVDHDLPRMYHTMVGQLGIMPGNMKLLLPQNSWMFLNMSQGFRRFLGRDGQPLFQIPQIKKSPSAAMSEGQYGIRNGSIGFTGAGEARNYLTGSREGAAAVLAETGIAGPMPFLPADVPNWNNVYTLPETAFGNLTVVLSPFIHAETNYYPAGHGLRNDDITGEPRPITTTDMLFFDGNYPFNFVETIPPTSWTYENGENRTASVSMIEAYALLDNVRGQQGFRIEEAVISEHDWYHTLTLEADKLKETNSPVGDGLVSS